MNLGISEVHSDIDFRGGSGHNAGVKSPAFSGVLRISATLSGVWGKGKHVEST